MQCQGVHSLPQSGFLFPAQMWGTSSEHEMIKLNKQHMCSSDCRENKIIQNLIKTYYRVAALNCSINPNQIRFTVITGDSATNVTGHFCFRRVVNCKDLHHPSMLCSRRANQWSCVWRVGVNLISVWVVSLRKTERTCIQRQTSTKKHNSYMTADKGCLQTQENACWML